VTDFQAGAGGDLLDLNQYITNYLSGWDGNANPFGAAGFLRLQQSGANTLLQVDSNGTAGGANFQTMVTLQGVNVAALVAANFAPAYSPDGGATPGVTLNGTSGNDTLTGTVGDDTLNGIAGFDTLRGGPGADTLNGGDDGDTLYGEGGADTLNGGAGNDTLFGGQGNDVLDGGDGNDNLYGEAGSNTLTGGAGNDYAQVVNSDNGSSTVVNLGADNDTLYLNAYGGTSTTATLGTGSDTLQLNYWGGGTVTVTDFQAGAGGDLLDLNQYITNYLSGWDGSSNPFSAGYMRFIQSGTSAIWQVDQNGLAGGENFQTAITFQNVDAATLTGANFFPGFNPDGSGIFGQTINGTGAGETLNGTIGDDLISGFGGADTVNGGNGNDTLLGGTENDLLNGGPGRDILTGGTGSDTFKFQPHGGQDLITDFTPGAGGDKLDIRDLLVGYNPLTSVLSNFVQLAPAGSDTTVSVDYDGTAGTYGFQAIATLQGQSGLLLNDLTANGNLILV
jgi:Ca2+-binding RTX toxin-like protein